MSTSKSKRGWNRQVLNQRDSQSIMKKNEMSIFDTCTIVDNITQSIEYPIMLPKNFTSNGNTSVLNLHITSSISSSRAIKPGMYDLILNDAFYSKTSSISPFKEINLFEQSEDSFYDSGSSDSLGEDPGTFDVSLKNKAQIRSSLPVELETQMLSNSSSIYYLNNLQKKWNLPTNSLGDHVGPFSKFARRTIENVGINGASVGTIITEDAKGFDAYGRPFVSGNLSIYRKTYDYTQGQISTNQTIEIVGTKTTRSENIIPYMAQEYPCSIQRSRIYDALSDETFTINIDSPFLLEKAVFEIPLKMGPSWFQDRTSTTIALASGTINGSIDTDLFHWYIDKGGPALTLSLFIQKNYGTSSIRDLVLTGTITHKIDSIVESIPRPGTSNANVLFENYSPGSVVEFFGLRSPSAVVSPGNQNSFTGSIIVKTQAAISNGAITSVVNTSFITGSIDANSNTYDCDFTPESFLKLYENLFASKDILSKDFFRKTEITSNQFLLSGIDAFGRGLTGFAASGGSIFGGEYVTPQIRDAVQNPLYIVDEEKRKNSLNLLSASLEAAILKSGYTRPFPKSFRLVFFHPYDVSIFNSNKPSPYLVRPGDKFVLAISKTRPVISASGHNVPDEQSITNGYNFLTELRPLTGSISGHDVNLSTGSINITFYGSYVKEGKSYIP